MFVLFVIHEFFILNLMIHSENYIFFSAISEFRGAVLQLRNSTSRHLPSSPQLSLALPSRWI